MNNIKNDNNNMSKENINQKGKEEENKNELKKSFKNENNINEQLNADKNNLNNKNKILLIMKIKKKSEKKNYHKMGII